MRVKTFLDKNLVNEDFLKVLSKIEGFGLNIITKENNYRDLFITGFVNKEYKCKITVNPLPAFAKGASVDEFNKAFATLDFKKIDKFVSDFWIEASYKSGGKEIKYCSESHVGNGSYMKVEEFCELSPWKMEYKDILKLFKENKIRIDGYKFFCGVRVVSLEIGGLNNDCYNLYLRVQLKEEVIADFDKMRKVNYLLTVGNFESLRLYIKNYYFCGDCKDFYGRWNFPMNTHFRITCNESYNGFDFTEDDVYSGEDNTVSVDDIENLLTCHKRCSLGLEFSDILDLADRKNISISFGSSKNLKDCIILELGGFTDSSKAVVYAFLKEDSKLSLDEICDCILCKEYEVVDDCVDAAFVFGYNSYQVIDFYSFGLDVERVRSLFEKYSK